LSFFLQKKGRLYFFAEIFDAKESSDELQKAQCCCVRNCAERKICCHSVEASLAVLEKSFLFLSSISSPFSQGRSAKMGILLYISHISCEYLVPNMCYFMPLCGICLSLMLTDAG